MASSHSALGSFEQIPSAEVVYPPEDDEVRPTALHLPASSSSTAGQSFPVFEQQRLALATLSTRLADGRPVLIVDPGSVGNLAGDKWAKEVAVYAHKAGLHPTFQTRDTPLRVSGVGKESEVCLHDVALPVTFRNNVDGKPHTGNIDIPIIHNSTLPGLLGMTALKRNRAILDLNDNKIYFLGPAPYDLWEALPPGTDCFQGDISPSGHLVIPCSDHRQHKSNDLITGTLTLMSNSTEATPQPKSSL